MIRRKLLGSESIPDDLAAAIFVQIGARQIDLSRNLIIRRQYFASQIERPTN